MADSGESAGDEQVVVTQEQIVTFEDEGTVEEQSLTLPTSMPEHLAANAREGREHEIKDFLSRPLLLKNFLWKATDAPATDLFIINFPNDLFVQPTVNEKINGFTWFRGDLVLRVNVNAQKFQQGFLLIYFVPYRFSRATPPPTDALTTKTGYPHVVMNLADSQSMTLKIPFVGPMSHLNIIREWWSIGSVVCTVYGQLAGGDAEIGGSVWGHFEDAEVTVPTGVKPYAVPLTDSPSMIKTYAQMGKVNQVAEKKEGFISGAAKAVGTVSKVAAMIPGLSTFAAPVAAVAGVVGNIASAFGFSKPTSDKIPEPYQVQTSKHYNNFNGGDLSKKLALDATNSISSDPIFGSGVDEMSLPYIAGTMNYYRTFNFTKTQTAGTVIFSTAVSPLGEAQQYKNYLATWVFTHLAFVARMFAYWSGGIKYKLRFVKTKFHSGRLRVSVVPQGIQGATVATFDANKAISYIIDLKEKSEFEFTVPYNFNTPMMPTGTDGFNNIPPGPTAWTAPAHSVVVISVLNELRTPSTLVSDTVNVIVEKGGAEDIAFYCPIEALGELVFIDEGDVPPPKMTPTRAQSGREDEQLQKDDSTDLFRTGGGLDTRLPLACVGETIVSARQILKRYQQVAQSVDTAFAVRPYAIVGAIRSSEAVTINDRMDFFSAFASIFAFMRGSMRLKIIYSATPNINGTFDHFTLGNHFDSGIPISGSPDVFLGPGTGVDLYMFRPTVVGNPLRDGIFELEVPFYNQYPMVPSPFSGVINTTFAGADSMSYPSHTTTAIYQCNTGFTAAKGIARAIGEDFSFGFLVGVPPIKVLRPSP